MNAASVDLKSILDSVSDLGAEVFVGKIPTTPDNLAVLFDTGGKPSMLTYNKEEKLEYPSVQVLVRNNDYRTAMGVINSIIALLHGRADETWNGAYYALIQHQNGPMFLEWDKSQRVSLIANFSIMRREV